MRFVIMLLAIVATSSLVHAQGADFEVTGGASLNGFTYTQEGALQYRGKAFSPAVTANPHNVARFSISRSPSSPLAVAISFGPYGDNRLYLLDTETFVSRREIHCTPQRTLLSPSQRYMVVHCLYSGDSFVSIDLQSRRVLIGNHLGREPAVVDPDEEPVVDPNEERVSGTKIWRLASEPKWMGSTDVLTFSADEYCTPGYSGPCTGQAAITATESYEVRLDAATLQVRATATGAPRSRPDAAVSRPISLGETVSGSLERGDPKLADNSYYDLYTYRGRPGERVVLTLRSRSFDAFLSAYEPRNGALSNPVTDDDGGSGTDARLEAVVGTSGVLAIEANSLRAGGTGAYELTLQSATEALPPAPPIARPAAPPGRPLVPIPR